MGTKGKNIERFKSIPSDFTFDELVTLLCRLEYKKEEKGKTSGSRAIFTNESVLPILVHKPHPGNIMPKYILKRIYRQLLDDGKIEEQSENS